MTIDEKVQRQLDEIVSDAVDELLDAGVTINPHELANRLAEVVLKAIGQPNEQIRRAAVAGLCLPAIIKKIPCAVN